MNLFDLNMNIITMNIDGKDIEMKPAICHGKVYDKWLVSECGKVWSFNKNRLLFGQGVWGFTKNGKRLSKMIFTMKIGEEDWWGDGSGSLYGNTWMRMIAAHKIVIDTWAPLYDNPPEGICWEEWEKVRDLPTIFNHISKTVIIDHKNNDPTDNNLENLKRTTSWDNQPTRKAKGI